MRYGTQQAVISYDFNSLIKEAVAQERFRILRDIRGEMDLVNYRGYSSYIRSDSEKMLEKQRKAFYSAISVVESGGVGDEVTQT